MKLFMILYVMGKISGVAGPLPYDIYDCQILAVSNMLQFQLLYTIKGEEYFNDPENFINGKRLTRNGYFLKCEYHDKRPEID